MIYIALLIILIEAVMILKWKIATHAMIYFMEKKGYTQPTSEEMAECTEFVGKHMLKDLCKSKL